MAVQLTTRLRWRRPRAAVLDLVHNRNKVTGATAAFRRELLDDCLPIRVPPGYWHGAWLALHAAARDGLRFLSEPLIDCRVHGKQQIGISQDIELRPMGEAWSVSFAEFRDALRDRYPEYAPAIDDGPRPFRDSGPFIPLRGVLKAFDALPRDRPRLFIITENHEIRRHLQSYWLYVEPDVARSSSSSCAPCAFRRLALSDHLASRGCELHAYLSAHDVLDRFARFRGYLPSLVELGLRRILKRPKYSERADTACLKHLLGRADALLVNPTLDFGVQLLRAGCSPFVKKELLRDNPHRDPHVPAGLDVATLRNADVERLLGSRFPRFDPA